MTALADSLRRDIAAGGPVTVAHFMAEALGNPAHGYYAGGGRDPLGAKGDFVTAPEISQMFGELIGLWCVDTWQAMGAPAAFRLVEMGPGHGTLMADALRAAALVPAFLQAASLHLVERSEALRARQARALARHEPQWHGAFAEVPDGPAIIVANEFFDALPVHQFVATAHGWRERMVGLAEDGEGFALRLAPGPTPALTLLAALAADRDGIAEVCPAGLTLAGDVGAQVAAEGGAALVIDYGRCGAIGDSLQALRDHRRHDPLADPGQADLTALVDFSALSRSAGEAGAAVYGPVSQGDFLCALGIETRADTLSRGADLRQAADIEAALARLTSLDAMGELFQVLAIGDPA
ncbi:MAG: SAM-dependent methyltransferase, partial [Alphaproteobacteria bacterium]|nr:SAM-dependent methyltransferase [Alphaproteobacteria bacterium]